MKVILHQPAFYIGLIINIFVAGLAAADPLSFLYHGWQVDLTLARGEVPDAQMINLAVRQLDIVEHVGLSPNTLQFMRGIGIWANANGPSSHPAHYNHSTGVDFRVQLLDPNRPIILHELLHAYHDRVLPNGFYNHDVKTFYWNGMSLWPNDSYMMSNEREFFAVTATTYLYGKTPRPPYSRTELCQKQPDYCQWLAGILGSGLARN